ncbi:hypothetical protein NC651_026161 [Populus alba x Populus x berolinensis]|nr:hypothetical protein NC651_026161 [Populus alba x Populus x berolinensis]
MENNYVHLNSDSYESSAHVFEYFCSMHVADAPIDQGVPISSSSRHTHQVNEEQRSYSIDLELKVHEEDIGKDLMHGQSDDGLLNYFDEAKYDLVCEGGVIFTLV